MTLITETKKLRGISRRQVLTLGVSVAASAGGTFRAALAGNQLAGKVTITHRGKLKVHTYKRSYSLGGRLGCGRTTGSGISVAIFHPRGVLTQIRTIRAAVGVDAAKL
jgi:hypothetical protein